MAIVFSVQGDQDSTQVSRGGGATAPFVGPFGTVKYSVRVAAQRSGGAITRVEAVPGEDVVVLQIAGGPELVLHPETARDLMRAQSQTTRNRDGALVPGEIAVPVQFSWQGMQQMPAARGNRGRLGDVLLTGFKVLTGGPKGVAADVVAHFDEQVRAGVHALASDSQALAGLASGKPLVDVPKAPAGSTFLVLIHGTFSSTQGTFSQFWEQHTQHVEKLFDRYGGRVYALEHATLGHGPIENARDLARALPDGAIVHLLTHSRGGLVAEVLARVCGGRQPGEADLAAFSEQPREQAALAELAQLAHDKRLRVERIVRVACPSRGTLLASRRLDAYVSVLRWTLQIAHVPVAPALLTLLGEIARQRLDARAIPGLAAQVPDSALVQWLHRLEVPVSGELRVVAGDMKGDSVTSWLKTLMADAFYWTDNDLVVQTRSMYGGSPRASGAAFVLDRGANVSHFAYFSNERTAQAIADALLHDTPTGFLPIGPLSWAGQDAGGLRAARIPAASGPAIDKPALVLLPGIVGSHLKVGDRRIWLGWRLINGLRQIAYEPGRDGVQPDGVIGRVYDQLIEFLSRSHEVIAFDYDWRAPIEEEAKRLGQVVQAASQARTRTRQPVRLLAHSMGGLVVRAMQIECSDVWREVMGHPQARVLMLGTPNAGSWAPMQVLSGDDTFGNALVAFGAPFQDHQARQMMAGFPGLLQLQHSLLDPDLDLDKEATWQQLADKDWEQVQRFSTWHSDALQRNAYRWGVPTQSVLDAAVALRRRLDKQLDKDLPLFADKIVLVLGGSERTPDGYRMADEGLIYLDAPNQGDGRVMDHSAKLPGVRTWRVPCDHGTLPDFSSAYPAYLDLLEAGRTALLGEATVSPDSRGRRAGETAPIADASPSSARHVPSRPSRQEVSATPPSTEGDVLAPAVSAQAADTVQHALRVDVINGDLSFVRQPLLVGHYTSLAITGAELAVDRLLGISLQRSLSAGLYPQDVGVHQIFHNTRLQGGNPWQLPRPESVVVVGLGPEGKLRPTDLVKAVRAGVLAWALRIAEQREPPASIEIAATLLGSGGLGISPGQSAQCIAQGVREANEQLESVGSGTPGESCRSVTPLPIVSRLLLIELFLDRATEAWQGLQVLGASSPAEYGVSEPIERADGALLRPLSSSYRGADYDLIIATSEDDGYGNSTIAYRLDTQRARSEIRGKATQTKLLSRLVAESATADGRRGEVGRTLFQLLVPIELEPFLGGATAVQIELDRGTAAIPWELLDTPGARNRTDGARPKPWALRTRLLRKLRTADFRLNVTDADRDCDVLIIGEPACTKDYVRLPGARREARRVAARLKNVSRLRGEVRALIAVDDETKQGPDATTVVSALLERDWRVVHIAGHGEPPKFDPPEPQPRNDSPQRLVDPGGVVLLDGTFLGPREIQSMRVVPELVFVNCCFSGARSATEVLQAERPGLRSGQGQPGFAAGVAEELIRIGVRCVVAAGWAVDDVAAEEFAGTFYTVLLHGGRFIDAVAEARIAAYAFGGNTWGAYQCYGDPDWRLRFDRTDAQRPSSGSSSATAHIASAPALVIGLQTVAIEAAYQDVDAQSRLAQLQIMEQRFGQRWGTMGQVAEAFGRAYNAVGDTPNALRWLEKAVQANDGGASLKAQEDFFNIQARAAWSRVETEERELELLRQQLRQARGHEGGVPKGAAAPPLVRKLETEIKRKQALVSHAAEGALPAIEKALDGLVALNALQATAERYNVCGSACKRRAMTLKLLGRDNDAVKALLDTKRHYEQAHARSVGSGRPVAFYAAMNALAAALASGDASPDEVTGRATQVHQLVEEANRLTPDFWSVAAAVEVAAWQALAGAKLHEQWPSIQAALEDLHDRVPDVSKWRSIHDQARFVIGEFHRRAQGESAKAEISSAQALQDLLADYAYPQV